MYLLGPHVQHPYSRNGTQSMSRHSLEDTRKPQHQTEPVNELEELPYPKPAPGMLLGCKVCHKTSSVHRALFKHPAICVKYLTPLDTEVTPRLMSSHNWRFSWNHTEVRPRHSRSHGVLYCDLSVGFGASSSVRNAV